MFNKARFKLTGWYLLIIMCVSMAFSAVIYRAASLEIERFATAQRIRYERRLIDPNLVQLDPRPSPDPIIDDELLGETRQRILMTLLLINLGILASAGLLGYYLSGKTLSPIKDMMDEQYRFISDASHELKTPITAIKTTLEVALRDKKLPIEEARETLSMSLDEVNRLQKLAEGLLALTRAGGAPTLSLNNLNKIVGEAVRTIQPLAERRKIIMTSRVPKIMVMVEPTNLTRAVVAILDNAVKYSPQGGKVAISARVDNHNVAIKISDQGKGIEASEIPMIFDRFYRSDRARSTSGYGLGLAIAQQIVREQHGNILVESKLNMGTTMIIELPFSAKLQVEGTK